MLSFHSGSSLLPGFHLLDKVLYTNYSACTLMKLSKKHGIVVVAFLAVIACGWGVFRTYKTATRNIQGQPSLPTNQSQVQQNTSQSEIDSVKDFVDGEYTLPPMDTSTWQTYRNEELGFEVKIPKNWEMREMYKEESKSIDIWFSQKGKWYEFEGGSYNAIILAISFKTNPFFQPPESVLKSFKESHENVSIQRTVINGVPFYYNNGFDEGVMTTASFPKNYSFNLSSSLILDVYPDVGHVLRGMIQTVKFDGINSTQQIR